MRLLTYWDGGSARLGARVGEASVIDLGLASEGRLPATLLGLLQAGPEALALAESLIRDAPVDATLPLDGLPLLPPLQPPTVRDFMAFEAHVRNAALRRGAVGPAPGWYEIPVFYFTNPRALVAPEAPVWAPPGSDALDFELEFAVVIGRGGADIRVEEAWDHVAGFMVLNDWSARDLQAREMDLRLGPAKGKDFALSLGPWLTTIDEVRDRIQGESLDLRMTARLNGKQLTEGSTSELFHSVPRLIAHAARGVRLEPGDVLGSGTHGGGCLLEQPEGTPWLQPGDVVELEVERLGILRNPVIARPSPGKG